MLYEVITCLIRVATGKPFWVIGISVALAALCLWVTAERLTFKTGRSDLVITSYSIHYTKLYDVLDEALEQAVLHPRNVLPRLQFVKPATGRCHDLGGNVVSQEGEQFGGGVAFAEPLEKKILV